VVHTEHGKHYSRQRSRWLGRLSAIAARQFFCVSSDIGTTVVEYGIASRKKVSVVPNGINVAAFADRSAREPIRHTLGIAMDAPVVGTVGRLSEIKSQDLLIRAFAQLHLPNADPHLLVVGDGAQREPLTTLARDLGLDKRIHFAGYQPDPAPFLAAMDIFALTSRSEGMPLAVLEAWAAGLPVVASRVGGMPELIEDGHTGVLFDYPDQGALVSHLQRLLCDRVRAERIGRAGQQLVRERFDVSIMAETYHRHYVELLSQAAPVCCPGV
jgi:glycosyltransferase involved in cell wall biosynthesis